MEIEALNKKIIEFKNEVMCRRESNQRKADKIWLEIKPYISTENAKQFEIEWKGHYLITGEHTPKDFAYYVDKLLTPNP